jgi:RHS repeat-associated protein
MNLGYTGKPYDTATGLYDYGFRDYKPQAVRFTTVDPIRDGNNWFAYVNNDPVNWVDPLGLRAGDPRRRLTQEERDLHAEAGGGPVDYDSIWVYDRLPTVNEVIWAANSVGYNILSEHSIKDIQAYIAGNRGTDEEIGGMALPNGKIYVPKPDLSGLSDYDALDKEIKYKAIVAHEIEHISQYNVGSSPKKVFERLIGEGKEAQHYKQFVKANPDVTTKKDLPSDPYSDQYSKKEIEYLEYKARTVEVEAGTLLLAGWPHIN